MKPKLIDRVQEVCEATGESHNNVEKVEEVVGESVTS